MYNSYKKYDYDKNDSRLYNNSIVIFLERIFVFGFGFVVVVLDYAPT